MTQLKDRHYTARQRYPKWENGSSGAELYNRASDPQDMVDLSDVPAHAGTVARLSKLLHQRIADASRVPAGVKQIAPQ